MTQQDHAAKDSSALRVQLLGGFQVTVGDRIVPHAAWRTKKARGLVKILALASDQRLHREQVMDLLWPELEPDAAANNLRYTLHAARRALEPERVASPTESLLRMTDNIVTLRPAGALWIDVAAFEAAASEARRARDPAAYQQALDLYSGDLLPEDRYEDWAAIRRDSLRELHIALLMDLARLHEGPRSRDAIEALQRVVGLEPAHEEAHVNLMRLYALTDQRHQALRQYQRLRVALRAELDIDPEPVSQQLYASILAGQFPGTAQPAGRDPEPASSTPRHNLPHALTSFVGRQRELSSVREALDATRLLTLTGIGGTGKTRLALEVARGVVDAYADGVWYVELAALAAASQVPQAVVSTLGIPEQPNQAPIEVLIDALRSKQSLLILDNCEHLIDACSQLAATLLGSCPQLRIMATSREVLRVPGELAWRVPPLDVPQDASLPEIDRLSQVEAVHLFVDRASFIQPGLALTPENGAAIVTICRQVDGLPLAIELAAARVPVLGVEQLAERLADTLHVLTGGSRTVDARHQTLRATLAWSYDLLTEPEQRLFERLAVFAGGWTIDAAEAVAAGDTIETLEVLDLLAYLVDKSLVVTRSEPGGDLRYSLLEPVRQYGDERLSASNEAEETRRRHAAFYLALAEQSDAGLKGPRQVEWLERLEADHDNVRAALAWAFEHDVELGARLAAAIWRFWYTRDHRSEGREWLARALTLSDSFPLSVRAAVLRSAGALAWSQGDYEDAKAMAEESVALYRELDNTEGLLQALSVLGTTLSNQGEYELAKQYHEESLALDRQGGNVWNVSRSLGHLAELTFAQGDYDTALKYWEESLVLDRQLADKRSVAITSNNIGEVMRARGDLERAKEHFSEGLTLFEELDFKLGIAAGLSNLADIHLHLGEDENAAKLLLQSIAASQELKHPAITATVFEITAGLAARQQLGRQAVRFLGAADALRASAGIPRSPAEQDNIAPWIDLMRSLLSDDAWTMAWEEGQLMTPDQACEKAVEFARLHADAKPQAAATDRLPTVLTRREREIAVLVAGGHTNAQIAAMLGMARPTADKHVSNILRKLAVPSRAEVRDWVRKHGLSPDDAASS